MEVLIVLTIIGLVVAGAIGILTALVNTVLVALGLSTISWWTVLLIIVIIKLFKWFIS